MLASEHTLIDISLISCSPNLPNMTELWNPPAGRQVYHQLFIFDQQQYRAEARPNVPKSNTKIEYFLRSVRAGNTDYQHSRKPWTLCAMRMASDNKW
jgi:hypothetical protein